MGQHSVITENTRNVLANEFTNTKLGLVRISKNLGILAMTDPEIIAHCRKIIQSTPIKNIVVRGKNYYLNSDEYGAVLTINKSSLGIITAKRTD